jgi:hypothetical protein
LGPEAVLGVVLHVMVVVTMMMMPGRSEGRAGNHHQEQCDSKNLFHGMNVALFRRE